LEDKPSAGGCQKLVREILGYLVDHPDAKDTIEGILKWWLPEGHAEWSRDEVEEALDALVSKGWVIKRKAPACKDFYGINKERLDEIGASLKNL